VLVSVRAVDQRWTPCSPGSVGSSGCPPKMYTKPRRISSFGVHRYSPRCQATRVRVRQPHRGSFVTTVLSNARRSAAFHWLVVSVAGATREPPGIVPVQRDRPQRTSRRSGRTSLGDARPARPLGSAMSSHFGSSCQRIDRLAICGMVTSEGDAPVVQPLVLTAAESAAIVRPGPAACRGRAIRRVGEVGVAGHVVLHLRAIAGAHAKTGVSRPRRRRCSSPTHRRRRRSRPSNRSRCHLRDGVEVGSWHGVVALDRHLHDAGPMV